MSYARKIKTERLEKLKNLCEACHQCSLGPTRTKLVFGDGFPDALFVFVGEAPGKDEDRVGLPFVGRSGKLLRAMIQAIEFTDKCYIANICKCQPPKNRPPEDKEIETCVKFLNKQIEIIAPKALVLLGRTAVKGLLPEHKKAPLDLLRGASKENLLSYNGIPVYVTYHPSALLRDSARKVGALEDFQFLQKKAVEFVQ